MVRNLGMGIIDYAPPVTMMPPPWHMLDGFLSEVTEAKTRVEYCWKAGKGIERRIYETSNGKLWAEVEKDAAGVGSEHLIKRYLTDIQDYRTMIAIAKNTRFQTNHALMKARMSALGEDGVVLGRLDRSPFPKCLIELAHPESFFLDLADETELLEELFEILGMRMLESVQMALDGPTEVFWLPDNVTAEMTSPWLFEKYCLPYYKKLSSLIHSAGKILLAHFDGKIRPLLPALAESGFDGIESMSLPEMSGDMTIAEARQALPGKAIVPNFPANRSNMAFTELVCWAECLKQENAEQPLLLQISEDLPPERIIHVARALVEAFRQ